MYMYCTFLCLEQESLAEIVIEKNNLDYLFDYKESCSLSNVADQIKCGVSINCVTA